MSSNSEVSKEIQSEEVLLELDNVERYIGESVEGPFKLVVTNRSILTRDEEGEEVEICFSAVGDFGIDDGSVYPQACVHVSVDVGKEGNVTHGEHRKALIYKQVKAADDATPDFDVAEIDYDNYSEPCIGEFRFVPKEDDQMELLYKALSDGMTAYKSDAENKTGETVEAAEEKEEEEDENEEKKDEENEEKKDEENEEKKDEENEEKKDEEKEKKDEDEEKEEEQDEEKTEEQDEEKTEENKADEENDKEKEEQAE